MPDDPPTPPSELPTPVIDALDGCSPEQLRGVARYAETLAEHDERKARLDGESAKDEESEDAESESTAPGKRPDDPPGGVPGKATLTVKEINDNRYYYWQWRDGDEVKSKYEGPAGGDG